MFRSTYTLSLPILIVLLLGPVHPALGQEPLPAPEKGCSQGVVFVLEGSGRVRLMADDLTRAVAEACLPLDVKEFNWSHGTCRVLADLRDESHHGEGP